MRLHIPTTTDEPIELDIGTEETLTEAFSRLSYPTSQLRTIKGLWRGANSFTASCTIDIAGQEVPVLVHSEDTGFDVASRAKRGFELRQTKSTVTQRADERRENLSHKVKKRIMQQYMDAEAESGKLTRNTVSLFFDKMDTDKNGSIDQTELMQACEILRMPADELLKTIDRNHDGLITKDEFMEWWYSESKLYPPKLQDFRHFSEPRLEILPEFFSQQSTNGRVHVGEKKQIVQSRLNDLSPPSLRHLYTEPPHQAVAKGIVERDKNILNSAIGDEYAYDQKYSDEMYRSPEKTKAAFTRAHTVYDSTLTDVRKERIREAILQKFSNLHQTINELQKAILDVLDERHDFNRTFS